MSTVTITKRATNHLFRDPRLSEEKVEVIKFIFLTQINISEMPRRKQLEQIRIVKDVEKKQTKGERDKGKERQREGEEREVMND